MTIDQAKLDEWKALADAATPGPWGMCDGGQFDLGTIRRITPDDPICELGGFYEPNTVANATFIAAAREAIPALIGEVERLTRERDELREALEAARVFIDGEAENRQCGEAGSDDDSEYLLEAVTAVKQIDAALSALATASEQEGGE